MGVESEVQDREREVEVAGARPGIWLALTRLRLASATTDVPAGMRHKGIIETIYDDRDNRITTAVHLLRHGLHDRYHNWKT